MGSSCACAHGGAGADMRWWSGCVDVRYVTRSPRVYITVAKSKVQDADPRIARSLPRRLSLRAPREAGYAHLPATECGQDEGPQQGARPPNDGFVPGRLRAFPGPKIVDADRARTPGIFREQTTRGSVMFADWT
jgi:hypothetical protein